ncbi:MAG: amidohydrolase, partial [Oscillospiraceae bacterium]
MGIDYKAYASSEIIENSDLFSGLSDEIWKLSELSLKEFQSTELYCELLEKLGFSLERNLSGIPTAFCGRYGSGQPTIGILGEFDALSGLSQRENVLEREELVVGGAGHGCGHNLLGAGALAAAYGIKRYLEKSGHGGTIIFFGCPGEEGGSGKAFMAREGAWRSLDCALSWHPDDRNEVVSGTNNSCIQKEYIFSGLSAHAAEAPERGRSALDAVELMNIGVQFLREHMSSSCRIHYSITDAGGVSPNVVQSRARVLYMIRSIDVADCIALTKRVDSIARGAALMTETEQIERFIDGCANLLPNFSLEKVLHDNLCLAKTASFDESDLSLAKQFIETFEYKRTGTPFVRDNTPDFVKQFVIGQC